MLILHVYFWFKCSLLRTTATACTIFVEFFCAIVFPIALPDTVRDATKALIKNCMLNEIPNEAVIFNAIEALIEPLKTPHISPITSAQKFATLAEFLINFTDVLEPAILFDAFAWNSFSSATVTATPIISKNIPINITKNNINIAGNNGKFVIEFVDINENAIDKINVVINTVTNHLILEFFSLLIFELVTLLFSATLFFELLFALLVELVEFSVFVKFSLEDLSFLLI